MNILEELGLKYGTDKIGKHNYLPHYYDMFKDRRNTVKKVLEIGVGEGAGLRMWRDFFPNAMIYGAEIDESRIFKDDRIEVVKCDQSEKDDLEYLYEQTGTDIDLVVDDGSHKPEDQVFTAWKLMLMLDTIVTYVIEDVADLTIKDQLGNYDTQVIECGKRYDDRLVVVKHKDE